MSRESERRRQADADLSKQTLCFLLGGAMGAAVALLFAPKSGRELREDLADATRKGVDRTRETATLARARAGDYAGSLREAASRGGEHISSAIEAGRRAYREEKERTETEAIASAPAYPEDR